MKKSVSKNKFITPLFDSIFLAILFWVARYWYSAAFGLYEDDLTIIPTAVSMKFIEILQYISNYIVHLYGHARPLSDSFIYFFSNIGWKISGIQGIYWIGYFITCSNILLFYWLIMRVAGRPVAFLASIAYCLYSADTTQVFLTHSLGLQPSITLLILGFHSYLSKKKLLAYIFVLIILFGYETPFLVFAAAPLLNKIWTKRIWREFAFHMLILGVMLSSVYALRLIMGEGRVSDLTINQILTIPFLHMAEGPFIILRTYLTRPFRPLLDFNLPVGIAMGLSLVAFVGMFWKQEPVFAMKIRDLWSWLKNHRAHPIPEEVKFLGRMIVAGLVMAVMAYPLTFTVDATVTAGRATRVHAAAVVGSALFVGCISMLFLAFLKRLGKLWLGKLSLALFFALLVGYGFILQGDYVLAWQYQQRFWSELIPLIPDAGEETAIFVIPDGLKDVYQIEANSWNLPRILDQLYIFPSDIKKVPRVFRLTPGWRHTIVGDDSKFQVDGIAASSPPSLFDKYDSTQVILIETESGHLVRSYSPVLIDDMEYPIKQSTAPILPSLSHSILYNLLITNP